MKHLFYFAGLFLSLLLTLISPRLWAETTTIASENPSLAKGIRQLGMGNTGIALPAQTAMIRDESEWFYNPAAIHDYEKKMRYNLLGVQGDISAGAIPLIFDVLQLKDDIKAAATTEGKINAFNTFVQTRIGDFDSVNARVIPAMVNHQWFSVAMIVDTRTTISFRNAAFTNFEIFSRSDGGGVIGGAYGFLDDQLQVGLNLKVLHRLEISEVVTSDDILNTNDLGVTLERGTGVGVDLGLKGKIPTMENKILDYLKPTVGLTYQDIGNTRFSGNVSNTQQSVSTGFALHPTLPLGDGLGSHFAVDFRELNQSSEFLTKLAVGYEVELPPLGFFHTAVRAGAYQGYVTGGLTADLKYGKLEFATYGQEVGATTHQKESRRIAWNLIFGF
ncbi:MAG: hypothetical protein HYS22_06355 [Deltaproteobacteria bacterium]|nr:hypothetical protein [Deltaproteobacteria bacterium]